MTKVNNKINQTTNTSIDDTSIEILRNCENLDPRLENSPQVTLIGLLKAFRRLPGERPWEDGV